jgi:hypothetical protein
MALDILRSTVREIVVQLAREDYESAIGRCVRSRLTGDDLRNVISDYGRRVVSPPVDAYDKLDAVLVSGTAVPTWSVRAPLWTKEEGRSDLTLELTIALGTDAPSIELDDLRAL